ncbi:MAG: hypothetical protein AAF587_39570 [Bacteroidota bacterium]
MGIYLYLAIIFHSPALPSAGDINPQGKESTIFPFGGGGKD